MRRPAWTSAAGLDDLDALDEPARRAAFDELPDAPPSTSSPASTSWTTRRRPGRAPPGLDELDALDELPDAPPSTS
ncbi:MAG: hypothetical protein GX632_00715 [Propioniciclava sp.]|nr:hypothetical protein [Propioniciclava sp.]